MKIFDPHIHMTSRSTDDYEAMARAGILAIVEPAFWLGQPRTNAGSFVDYFNSQGLANEPTQFSGRSDYGPFIARGIPAGGLFTGAEGIKTAAQAVTYGGTAGTAYDPCYHLACDTFANNSNTALDQMTDAAAHVMLTLSRTKVDITVEEATAAIRSSGSPAQEDFHDHDHEGVTE